MHRSFFVCIGLIVFSAIATAQTSVGLTGDNPKPIYDYRLPDWGYSSGTILFSASGGKSDRKGETSDQLLRTWMFSLTPTYTHFKESEERVNIFDVYLYKSYRYSKNQNKNSSDRSTEHQKFNRWQLSVSDEYRHFSSGSYWRTTPQANYFYDGNRNKYEIENLTSSFTYANKYKMLNRYYDIQLVFGLGVGRVRNVTPVIRALRLNERVYALGKGIELDESQVEQAAAEFTKYPGYQTVYDRPEKYFWDTFAEQFSSLTPFEAHYLNDIFSEIVGNRLEGTESDLSVRFIRIDALQKLESSFNGEQKTKIKSTFAGPEWRLRSYHNYSLKAQMGFTGQANWDFRLNDKEYNPIENVLQFRAGVEHLYVIADRILWKVNPSYSRVILKSDFSDDKYTSSLIEVNSSVSFFIEDRFSLDGSATWSYLKNKPQSLLTGYILVGGLNYLNQLNYLFDFNGQKTHDQWSFQLSLNYYLGRRLL